MVPRTLSMRCLCHRTSHHLLRRRRQRPRLHPSGLGKSFSLRKSRSLGKSHGLPKSHNLVASDDAIHNGNNNRYPDQPTDWSPAAAMRE